MEPTKTGFDKTIDPKNELYECLVRLKFLETSALPLSELDSKHNDATWIMK